MSSLTTGTGVLALAILGVFGWQSNPGPDPISHPFVIPSDPPLAAALPGFSVLPARLTAEDGFGSLRLPNEIAADGSACGMQVEATARPPATVDLTFRDECQPDQVFELRHAGLSIHLRTDAMGHGALSLPALENPARIAVIDPDGVSHDLSVTVPDLTQYHRTAFGWSGAREVALHAQEPGRAIHPGNPGSVPQVLLGNGGHLSVLGAADLGGAAQIYTFPRDTLSEARVIRLSLVLPADPMTCGTRIAGQRIEIGTGLSPRKAELSMSLPDCDPDATDLVLQNMFHDLRIASQ